MRLALEGRFVPGQPPTGFVLYAHSALGWALVTLYDLSLAVPWWDLVLAGTLFWALAVFVALAWPALGVGWCARATALSAVCIGGLPLIATMQFTFITRRPPARRPRYWRGPRVWRGPGRGGPCS